MSKYQPDVAAQQVQAFLLEDAVASASKAVLPADLKDFCQYAPILKAFIAFIIPLIPFLDKTYPIIGNIGDAVKTWLDNWIDHKCPPK